MAQYDSVLVISSSPEFPSIDDLVQKPPRKPALRTGSNAAPLPTDAIRAFTTATSVWKSNRIEGESAAKPPSRAEPKPNEVELNATIEPPEENTVTEPEVQGAKQKKTPAARKPRKKKSDEPKPDKLQAGNALPPEKPKRKPRAPKVATDAQTTLPKAKVTKPAKEKAPRKKAETVSRHFSKESTPKPVPATIAEDAVDLEPAMRRRHDWTPPPETVAPLAPSTSPAANQEPPSTTQDAHPDKSNALVFESLQDTYGCKMDEEQSADSNSGGRTSLDVLGKRKLLELVPTGAQPSKSPEQSPVKSKAPKKKARTITELATAAYRVQDVDVDEAEASKQGSLLDHFSVGAGQDACAKETAGKAKPRKRATKPKASKKKPEPKKPILLSPTSALRQVAVQDFVFGTSSQLATEEDAEFLKALHESMKASNQPDADPFLSSSPVIGPLATRRRSRNRLWAAGARDEDGDLLDIEVLDLTESPPPPQDFLRPASLIASSGMARSQPPPKKAEEEIKVQIEIQSSPDEASGLDDSFPPIDSGSHFFSTQLKAKSTAKAVQKITPGIPKQPGPSQATQAVELDDWEPPPSNQEHYFLIEQSQSSSSPKAPPPAQPDGPKRPKYELFTDAQLAREIAAYGFKPIKRRSAMIELLEECWASKNQAAVQSTTAASRSASNGSPSRSKGQARKIPAAASTANHAAPTASPGRPRGRPKKDSLTQPASKTALESPKRGRGRPKKDAAGSPAKAANGKESAVSAPRPPPAQLPTAAASTPKRLGKIPAKPPVFEIADSDMDSDLDPFASSPISSPHRDKHPELFSSPRQDGEEEDDESMELDPDLSIVNNDDAEGDQSLMQLSPTDQQAEQFRYITKAITTAPGTKDPENPSWHEKMLMYDPIILEDLTAWLNTGQLDRVGYDGEVLPAIVKKWCESKSVCSVWRVNTRGKERTRY